MAGNKKKIVLTGAAGFIGFHLSMALLSDGHEILGIDNVNDYYSPTLKRDRLNRLKRFDRFTFEELDLNSKKFKEIITRAAPDHVIHLAAQAGVRYSIENPGAYIESNCSGFLNVLEAVKNLSLKHLVYASSSSVYGSNSKLPFEETDVTDSPVSLYAATKKFNELMATVYSNMYRLPLSGLRFFTVYGSWGRPDMAYFGFAKKMQAGEPIDLFNNGKMRRDFTHISDIIKSIILLLDCPPSAAEKYSAIYNIGASEPVELREFIEELESALGLKAKKNMLPMQPGDVHQTYANVSKLKSVIGYAPEVHLKEGLAEFADWFKSYEMKN